MKLTSVTLSGILAYEDEVIVDLSRTSPDRNLILIWGRNGKGKTSFITALKLLFAGIEEERARLVGFPPRSLPPGQYVLGDGEHWMGIINRRTVRDAATSGSNATASVEARWEQDGKPVVARREWSTAPGGAYTERVMIQEGETRLTDRAARDRLADFLPPDYVGFFFFDGEDIKSLAETAERKSIDFDQLLRITFVRNLASEITDAATERRRRTLSRDEKNLLRQTQVLLDESEYIERDAAEQLRDIDDQLVNQQAKLRRAETVRDNLSSGATDAQRKTLEKNRKELAKSVEEAMGEIVARVPAGAPVNANLPLIITAMTMLDQRLDGAGAAEQRVIGRVIAALPTWVEELDLKLSKRDRELIVSAFSERLGRMNQRPPSEGLFASLDLDRAARLRANLARLAGAGPDVRAAQTSMLVAVHRQIASLTQLDDQLMRLRVGSESNIERYRENERLIREIEEKIATLNQAKGVQLERHANAVRDQQVHETKLKELEALAERAGQDEVEAKFMDKVATVLLEAREALRQAARDQVETLLNQRFKELVVEHPLVATIRIDDTYTLNFFDAADRPIGRASLSSGLKQLAATALLWAMKDASGHDMPVIIDTPLGRIDRENQDRMLTRYYPFLSDQVIILPTNAEIDRRKKGEIHARIAEEYHIANDTGDSATILPGPMENI